MKITYQGLTIVLPLEGIVQVEDFTLSASFNAHAWIRLLLLAGEEGIQKSIHEISENAKIEVYEDGPLFIGKVTEAETAPYRGLYCLKIKAVSCTMDWQLAPVSQSFLNLDATYGQVMRKVLEDQERADIMDCVTGGAVIPDFLLQYEETDWDFLVRLASHFQSFLIPDYRVDYGRAYFGIPQSKEEIFLSEEEYETVKDMDRYYHVNLDGELLSQEIMKWNVRTGRSLRLAQAVAFRGLRTIVTSIDYRVASGELCRFYELSREKGVRSVPLKNRYINGMSIPATVMERAGNCVRVHFHIDKEYDSAPNLRYFTFAIESSFIYCMPEVGSQVHIYFPTDEEKDAVAVHAIRMSAAGTAGAGGSGGGGYAQNPDFKSFSNVNGSELLLTPSGASAAADREKKTIVSLDTTGDVYIVGKEVSVRAENDLLIGEPAGEGGEPVQAVSMVGGTLTASVGSGETKIELTEEAKIIAAFVKLEASDTTPASPAASEIAAQITEGDAQARADHNEGVSTQIVDKYIEGRSQVLGGVTKILAAVGTVALAVAVTVVGAVVTVGTAGVGAALVGPAMLGTYALAATTIGFAASDITEGAQDMSKSRSGDLSESFNPIRDTVFESLFGDNKQMAYDIAKVVNDIAFGVVSGKAIGGGFQTIGEANKVLSVACGSQKLNNVKTAVQVGGNMMNGAMTDLICNGKVDPAGLVFNMGLGLLQGQIGSRLTKGALSGLGINKMGAAAQKVGEVVIGTGVDTGLDWVCSGLTGREFDLMQSLGQNAFANSLSAAISDPVDAVTGSYMLYASDLVLASLPDALRMERTYRSGRKTCSAMGRGWLFVYDSRIYRDTRSEGSVHLDTITGHAVYFERQEDGWVNRSRGTARFLLGEEDGCFVLTDVTAHTRCRYDREGRLVRIEYPNCQCVELSYDGDGLRRIVSPLGNILRIESRNGRILEIADEIGRRIQYRYEGELLTDVVHADEGTSHYAYDENGYIVSVTDENGNRYLENDYDGAGRVVRQTFQSGIYQTFAYDDQNRRNTVSYSENKKTEIYEYNSGMLAEKVIYEDGTWISYAYSDDNLRIRRTSRTGAENTWEYDAYGRQTAESGPSGFTCRYAYDENHDLVRVWDTDGRETRREYDGEHNVLCVREKIDDGQWRERRYTYDSRGRKLSETDGVGNTVSYRYEQNGAHPVRVTTPKGEETAYGYDRAGRRMTIDNTYGTVELGYNSRNFVTKRTDGEGNVTRWTYDRMGHLSAYYPAERLKRGEPGYTYRYDYLERLTDTISPLGIHHRELRNFDGDVVKSIHPVSYREKKEEGAGTVYDYDKDGNCIRIRYADGGVERRFYDADGHMLRRVMPQAYDRESDNGAGYTYGYDAAGRVTSVRDPEGNVLHTYEYNGHGQVLRETDGEGGESLYSYNGLGLKTKEQTSVRREGDTVLYRVTAFSYDSQGNKVEEAYGKQEVTKDAQPVSWHTIHFAYDGGGRLARVWDESGAQTRYDYDCLGNRIYEEQIIEEGIYRKIRYTYNKSGWRIRRREEIQGNGTVRTAETSYAYDADGNLTLITRPDGSRIVRDYDWDGRLVSERTMDRVNGIDRTVRYTYDDAGNVTARSVEGGAVKPLKAAFRYDLKNRLTHRTGRGAATRYLYDHSDRLVKEIAACGGAEETDGAVTAYDYDSRGNRIRTTNALGQTVEERTYNLRDMPAAVTDGLGGLTERTYTMDGHTKEIIRRGNGDRHVLQSWEYNARGQITDIVDGNGVRTSYGLDDWGRITTVRAADGTEETYAYTPSGHTASAADGNGATVRCLYNSFGKMRERIDQTGGKETFLYDAEGRLTRYTDRDGNRVCRDYDVLGNLVYEKAVDKNGENPCVSTYRYDAIGRLVQAVCGGASYEYTYDEQGRLKEKRSAGKRLLSYTYDTAGRTASVTDPAGVRTDYEYDILGRTSRVHSTDGADITYQYDALNRVKQTACGNGIRTCYQYDQDGNLSRLETRKEDTLLLSLHYTYDANANRLTKTGIQPSPAGNTLVNTTYTYDKRDRLLQENNSGDITRYTYDPAGNRITKQHNQTKTLYTYNQRNQLTSIQTDDTTTLFTYNRQGSILKEQRPDAVRTYTYNTKNQQTQVELEDGTVQTNRYDPEGLRHEMEENGKLLRFVYHKGELVYERGEKEQTSYHQGAGTEALNRAGKIYYYHKDEQLSTALITDEQGAIKNTYLYDAFGNALASAEQIENRIRYTGQQYDGITGQYYLRARYYNPAVGRFMQEDTYRGDGLNLYAYCANNPVTYYDPSGYAVTSSYVAADGGDGGEGSETYYRTMSQEDYDQLRMTGELPPTNETFISPTQSFSNNYEGVTVEFEVKAGTTDSLREIGVSNNSAQSIKDYGEMPQVQSGWNVNNAFFKGEGLQTNIGLGQGYAREIFNSNIISFKKVGGE